MNTICNLQFAICNLQSPLFGQVDTPGAAGTFSFTADPSWPWWAIALVASILVGLTIWTYRGVPQAGTRRVSVILLLRLAALVVALLSLARPSLAVRDEQKFPSLLIIVLDQSESMTIQDAADNKSRWLASKRVVEQCEAIIQELAKQQITVKLHAFDAVVRDYDPEGKADGPRSDYGFLLHHLYDLYGGERHLRGVLILGDGADNGTRFVATSQAERWRARAAPVQTFIVGSATTSPKQRDVALTAIFTEPTPVPVKGKLTVRVLYDAPSFENQPLRFHLHVDDNPKDAIPVVEEIVRKPSGNEVKLTVDAPDKPGEIKVTVKADPLPGEVTTANNEISTFVTVAKEGMSILLVGGLSTEQMHFGRVLRSDPRIRLYEINRLDRRPAATRRSRAVPVRQAALRRHHPRRSVGQACVGRQSPGAEKDPRPGRSEGDRLADDGRPGHLRQGLDRYADRNLAARPARSRRRRGDTPRPHGADRRRVCATTYCG